jgi:hypothetical protein
MEIVEAAPDLTVEEAPTPTDGRAEIGIGVASDGGEAVPGLVAALVAAGVRIYRVTPHEPSLEDVYFAIHDANAVATEEAAR